jgi:hypothetical protein
MRAIAFLKKTFLKVEYAAHFIIKNNCKTYKIIQQYTFFEIEKGKKLVLYYYVLV